MKENTYCDMETGICGPTDDSSPVTGFIDLSAPKKETQPDKEETEETKED